MGDKHWIAGVDEAGRGPLAGPVIAAAVILDPLRPIAGLADSKTLSQSRREQLLALIVSQAKAVSIGRADHQEIDKLNILQATMLAMRRALIGLEILPAKALIDGNRVPDVEIECDAIIKGDQSVACIQAASIVAKVTRDREMVAIDSRYPGYGFAEHKGYGTKSHLAAIHELGPCPIHRTSFRPISQLIALQVMAEVGQN